MRVGFPHTSFLSVGSESDYMSLSPFLFLSLIFILVYFWSLHGSHGRVSEINCRWKRKGKGQWMMERRSFFSIRFLTVSRHQFTLHSLPSIIHSFLFFPCLPAGDSFGKSWTREKGMASLSLTSPPLGSLGRCKRQREGERSVFSFASLTPFLSYSFPMLSLSITSLYHRWNGGEERDKERNGLGASCVTSVTNK